jgi:hypothetical protein
MDGYKRKTKKTKNALVLVMCVWMHDYYKIEDEREKEGEEEFFFCWVGESWSLFYGCGIHKQINKFQPWC